MSSVDERIVEMRFENDQFESGVNTSLKTLAKLKSGLDLSGAADGLNNLQNTANRFDISGLSDNVDKITNRFSILGIMVDQVTRRLTDGLISLGDKAVSTIKNLTIDQIPVGFDKYERKIQSVQTIMNATGKSIEDVNANLDKLNWYTDETSYSFTDMVDNIGKFTSSGVSLEEATTSMIGIANAAGYAGANVQDASHAMEGFSKAMGQGYMSRQNWQWIRTAHMDTVNFKEQMIQAAVAQKTLAAVTKKVNGEMQTLYYVADKAGRPMKKLEVSVADFETNLAKGWLTKDVMNSALAEYGSFTEQIYEEYMKGEKLTSEIIEDLGADADNLGLKAFRASQEAKTFTDAINSVKDAVSTGWMVSFEQIFGNYEEAKKLWTAVANELWDVFASGAERRNEMLKEWHDLGGYEKTINAFSNIWQALRSIGETARETFESFFPPTTTKRLLDFTYSLSRFANRVRQAFVIDDIEEFTSEIGRSQQEIDAFLKKNARAQKNLDTLKDAFSGLFSIAKLGTSVFKSLIQIISPLSRLFSVTGKNLFELSGSLGKFITNTVDAILKSEKYEKVVNTLTKAVDSFTSFLIKSGSAIKDFALRVKNSDAFKTFTSTIISGAKSIKNFFAPYISQAGSYLTAFLDKLDTLDFSKFNGYISTAVDWLKGFYNACKDIYKSIKSYVSPYLKQLGGWFQNLGTQVYNSAKGIYDFWKNLYDSGQLVPYVLGKFTKLKDKIIELGGSVKDFIKGFSFSDAINKVKDFFGPFKDKLDTWISETKERLANLDLGKVAAVGLTTALIPTIVSISLAFTEAAKLLKSSRGLVTNLNDILNKFKSGFKSRLMETAKAVTVFAVSVGILAASMKLISTIDADKIKPALTSMLTLSATLTGMATALGLLGRFKLLGDMKNIGLGMMALSAAVAILAASMLALDRVKPENAWKNIAIIGVLMASLATVSGILGKYVPELSKGSLTLVSFAASILILTEAFTRLSKALSSSEGIGDAVNVMLVLMAAMTAFSAVAGKVKFGSGFGLLGMVGSIFLLLKIFEKLSDSSIKTISEKAKNNLGFIAATLGALAALAAIGWLGGNNAGKTGMGILAMSASVLILYEAVKKLGELDGAVLAKGGIAVAGILALFALLSKVSMYANKDTGKIGLSIMAMSVSLLAVYLAIKKIGSLRPDIMVKGLLPVIGILGMFAVLSKSLKGVNASFGGMLGIAIAIGTLVAALSYLTLFNVPDLAKSVIALGTTLLAMAGALKLASGVKFDKSAIGGFVAGIVAIGAIAFAINALAGYSWSSLAAAAGGISVCLVAIAAAMKIISTAKFNKETGLGQILALAAGLASFYIVGAILASLTKYNWDGMIPVMSSVMKAFWSIIAAAEVMSITAAFLGKVDPGTFVTGMLYLLGAIAATAAVFMGISWLVGHFDLGGEISKGATQIGEALGGFLGGIAGNGIDTVAKKLPSIAESLSSFMDNAGGFFTGLKDLGPDLGTNILNLAKGIKELSKLKLETTGKDGATTNTLTKSLTDVASALSAFSNKAANINLDNISLGVEAASQLNALLLAIAPSNGLIQDIFGTGSWNTISSGLAAFGTALSGFSTNVNGININNVQKGTQAGEMLNGLLTNVPLDEGLWQKWFGGKTWSTLSKGLKDFGDAMTKFSDSTAKLDSATMATAIEAGKGLSELLNSLPSTPSKLDAFAGTQGPQWSTINTGLADFGTALSGFSTNLSEFNASAVNVALTTIGRLPTIFNSLGTAGFNNPNTSSMILKNITGFSDALTYFDVNAAQINAAHIQAAYDAIEIIGEAGANFIEVGTQLGNGLNEALQAAMSPESASAIGLSYVTSLNSAFNSLTGNVTSSAEAIGQAVITGVSGKVGEMSTIAPNFVNTFATALVANSAPVTSAGTNVAEKVVAGAKAGSAEMSGVGVYAGAGLISGLKSQLAAAYAAGLALGNAVSAGAKAGLKVASPSKVMKQIGEFSGEGLAIGLENMIPFVGNSAAKMAKSAVLATADALKGLDNLADNSLNMNPVITPVLDLTSINYDAQRLNTMLNSSMPLSISGNVSDPMQQNGSLQELAYLSAAILKEIQNGSDLYFDDGAFAGRINRRLGIRI